MAGRQSSQLPENSKPSTDTLRSGAAETSTRRKWFGYLAAFSTLAFTKRAAAEKAARLDRYAHVPAGTGTNYNWGSDHLFVKLPGTATGGAYNLIEDNLQPTFALGLHLHRDHAETFYIVRGSVDFYVVDHWITVKEGGTLHIPPGTPHAAAATPGVKNARMIMIYQPGGFDTYLSELTKMPKADRNDPAKMQAFNERYDFIHLGPVPKRD